MKNLKTTPWACNLKIQKHAFFASLALRVSSCVELSPYNYIGFFSKRLGICFALSRDIRSRSPKPARVLEEDFMDQNSVNNDNAWDNWSDYDWKQYDQSADDWSNGDGYGLTVDAERSRIENMLKSSVNLTPSAKDDLEALQSKLNFVVSENGDAQAADLKAIDKQLNDLEHPDQAKKDMSLDQQITDFLKEHADTIDGATKQQWEKYANEVQLHPDEEKVIASEFKKFQSSVIKAGLYSPNVQKISEQTGVSMDKIQSAAEKLGIKDLSNLTTEQAVKLLPDVGGETIQNDIDAVTKAYAKLQDSIDSNTNAINQSNDANRGHDNDEIKIDSTPFQAMMKISSGTDNDSVALRDAVNKLNKDSGPVLAAILGKSPSDVKFVPGENLDPNTAEGMQVVQNMANIFGANIPRQVSTTSMLSIGGDTFSLLTNLRTGDVGFNKNGNALPNVELPPIYLGDDVDGYDDGDNDNTPQWVMSQGYPIEFAQD